MTATSDTSPVWFITGCSTGIGRALSAKVLEHGYRCVVTARNPDHVADLGAAFPDTALVLALDVADRAQVKMAVDAAHAKFGSIDILVNNAGHGYNAAVEEGDEAQVRAMFDTNFFGLAAVMRAVLPLMRANGRGHVINLSSVGGLVGSPAAGYYNASKFAVEGLSEALAKEVAPLGIRVTLVEPGPFRTDFQGRSIKDVQHTIDAYAGTAAARRAQLKRDSGRQAGDPARAADAIILVARSENPPLHLLLGKNGYLRAREKLTDLLRSMDEWEKVSLAADFPD